MQQTAHFNLNKPDGIDDVDIADLNANADAIDQELYNLGAGRTELTVGNYKLNFNSTTNKLEFLYIGP